MGIIQIQQVKEARGSSILQRYKDSLFDALSNVYRGKMNLLFFEKIILSKILTGEKKKNDLVMYTLLMVIGKKKSIKNVIFF